jgi:hypothetical protein
MQGADGRLPNCGGAQMTAQKDLIHAELDGKQMKALQLLWRAIAVR